MSDGNSVIEGLVWMALHTKEGGVMEASLDPEFSSILLVPKLRPISSPLLWKVHDVPSIVDHYDVSVSAQTKARGDRHLALRLPGATSIHEVIQRVIDRTNAANIGTVVAANALADEICHALREAGYDA